MITSLRLISRCVSSHAVRASLALLSATTATTAANAGPTNDWQALPPLEGGTIECLYFDASHDWLFAGTHIQSSYGGTSFDGSVLRSTDHGQSWTDIGAAIAMLTPYHRVRSITRAPSGAIMVALDKGGVARSIDEGTTWALVTSGLGSAAVRVVALSPSGTAYAITDANGVFISANEGQSWSASNAGLSALTTRSVAFAGNDAFVSVRDAGVFRRTGLGAWSPVNTGLGSLKVNAVGFLPDGRLAAASDLGVWLMDPSTLTWSALAGPFSSSQCDAVVGTGSELHIAWAGGVATSLDGGGSWQPPGANWPSTSARALAIDGGARLFAGSPMVGVHRSVDSGASWSPANTGINAVAVHRLAISPNGDIFVGTFNNGIFRLANGASVWEGPWLPGVRIFSLAASPWGDLYAGNYTITNGQPDGHVWRSGNGGDSWDQVGGTPGTMVSGFQFGTDDELWCSVAWTPGGIWHSVDGGDTLLHIAPPQNIPAYCLLRTPGGDLYFGTEGKGVWRVPADGSPAINLGLQQSQQFTLAQDSAGRVFVGNDRVLSALWRSSGGGQPFAPLSGLPGTECFAVLVLPDDSLLAGTRAFGIHRSLDHGDTWDPMTKGIAPTSCFALAIAPDGRALAAVPGAVHRSTLPLVQVVDLDSDGSVNGADLAILLGHWGSCTGSGLCNGDVNGDGVVDGADLASILGAWTG